MISNYADIVVVNGGTSTGTQTNSVLQHPDVRMRIEIQHGLPQDNPGASPGQASWRGIDPANAWERRVAYCAALPLLRHFTLHCTRKKNEAEDE